MKARGNSKAYYLLVVLLTLGISLALAGPSFAGAPVAGAMENYCVVPPFIGTTASPLVMLMMQKDEKLWHKAYNDVSDVDGDGLLDFTYKHLTWDGKYNEYYGYFDSYKCYEYSATDDWFKPVDRVDSEYYCSGSWSGNFLNWATMTRIDIIRKVFFGGYRFVDDPAKYPPAVLERAFLPPDGHSFVKTYACDPDSTKPCDIDRLTPFKTHPTNPDKFISKLSLCSTTLGGYGSPPLVRVAAGDDYKNLRFPWDIYNVLGWERWAANEKWQCALKGEKTDSLGDPIGDDSIRPGAEDHVGDFTVRLVACDPAYITDDPAVISNERCRYYEQLGNYMPSGLVQEYGEDSSMYFGLMTGSYDRNKSGGVLRAKLTDFGDLNSSDVNRTTGAFTNLGAGVWPTLKGISIANYDYSTGSYEALDNCPDKNEPFSDGQCSNWGNPLAEMYYEGLRYFVGKDSATVQYQGSDSNVKKPSMNLTSQTWNPELDPYSQTHVEPCAEAFALVISDPYPAYDGDQLPGSALGAGIDSDLPAEIPPLDVAELAREIGDNEGIHGKRWRVGNVVGTITGFEDQCTAKTVTDLSRAKGVCPLEPGREGSYYLPALALYGQRTDLRPGFTNTTDGFGQTGNQNLTTYAVSLGGNRSAARAVINGHPIEVEPYCMNSITGKPCTLVDFRHAWTYYNATGMKTWDVYIFTFDGSQQGGDYDNDVTGQLWLERRDDSPYNLYIAVAVDSKSTEDILRVGYMVEGSNHDGVYPKISVNYLCTEPKNLWTETDPCADLEPQAFVPGTSPVPPLPSPLWLAAKYGGFRDANGNNLPDQTGEWDGDGNGVPDTYFEASDPTSLENKLIEAFSSILNRVTSGTAASVLASGEGSGANLVQAVYYPRKRFLNRELSWLGSLHNYWYYVDPFFKLSTIREDTPAPPALYGDKVLNLTTDNIVHMYFDDESLTTKVDLYRDNDGDGKPDYKVGTKGFGDVAAIWKAGLKLWARDVIADPREVYTVDETGARIEFSTANAAQLAPLMNVEDRDGDGSNVPETEDIIRYVLGEHVTVDRDGDGKFDYLLRSRLAGIDLNNDGDINDTVNVDLFGDGTQSLSETNVWKLGDIVDSTPKIASYVGQNDYDVPPPFAYGDETYGAFINTPCETNPASPWYSTLSPGYKDRGTVYVGANDGMLHAFKLGKHPRNAECDSDTMRLDGGDLGREQWSFIPRNALPYLKYLAEEDYCHVNTIDLSPYLVDASVFVADTTECSPSETGEGSEDCKRTVDSWRTILIGGMRFGGACDPMGTKNAEGVDSPVSSAVLPNHGLSSYFALDVTSETPEFLWEFSNQDLGFSTTGPAIVRINGMRPGDSGFPEDDTGGEHSMGRWFAVFGSGPTGPIDTRNHQFMAHSHKSLRLFVVDLWDGSLDYTIEPDPPIEKAFAGSMLNATVDADKDYSDDVLYVGYTQYDSMDKAWTNGGVGRLITNYSVDPALWEWSVLLQNAGPVTASPSKIVANDKEGPLWVYPATGRYYYKLPKELDDEDNQRALFGIIDDCYLGSGVFTWGCSETITDYKTQLERATDNDDLNRNTVENTGGWYIELEVDKYDDPDSRFGAERVVTDIVATTEGYVFFTSFKPYNGACVLGGQSYVWIVNYDNGGAPGFSIKGKALVQVSTGAIEEIDLRDALREGDPNDDRTYGRRTMPMEGVPPMAQGLSLMTPPASTSTIIHFRER